MRLALKLHPESVCEAVSHIEVDVSRPASGALALRYVVHGTLANLRLPAPAAAARADGLWQQTCFEAFLREPGKDAYREFNFAPSTQWAAYSFDAYRTGMREAPVDPPRIETLSNADGFELQATLNLGPRGDAPCQFALSAVIQEADGRKSYWALAHPPGKADFHHPCSFAHELP
jgi:hypothetical protein